MSIIRKYHLLRVKIGLVLIAAIALNTAYQSSGFNNDPIAIDVCEHIDSETECDEEEKNKSDDVYSQSFKRVVFHNASLEIMVQDHNLEYCCNHPDIFTPPPEYLS